jgi:hypothetical protein
MDEQAKASEGARIERKYTKKLLLSLFLAQLSSVLKDSSREYKKRMGNEKNRLFSPFLSLLKRNDNNSKKYSDFSSVPYAPS